ncbi:MAG: Kelch repeat-containing protein, partial [Polyangiales bacterium]
MHRRAFLVLALLSACSHREEPPAPAPKVAPLHATSPVLDRLRALPVRIDSTVRLARVGSGYALAGLTTGRAGFSPLGAERFGATVPGKTTDAVHLGVRDGETESFAFDVLAEDVSAGVAKEGVVEGGAVVFAEATVGVDVVHLVEPGRVEELRIVRVPSASVTMRHRLVPGRGVAELRLREGRVEALDHDGIVRIASAPEIAWDANGAVLPVALALKKEGDQYVLESRVVTDAHPFPVTIDPSWAPTVDVMTTTRAPAWAFALPGNKVLVLGASKSTDVFDPYAGIEGKWVTTPPAPLVGWSGEASAIQLPDGKILTAGVSDGVAGIPAPNYPYLSYVYDPATGTSTRVGDMPYRHGTPTLTLLSDGRVVAFGTANGSSYFNASVDVYDPASKSWTHGVTLASSLHGFVQAKLPSGKVLIAGGAPYGGGAFSTALIYDATANTTAPTGSMSAPRTDAAVITLADGKIMAIGGYITGGYTNSAEIFDESTGSWTLLANKMAYARYGHAVTKLTDGRYLITGGQGYLGTSGSASTLSTAEYYDPVAKTFAAAPSMGTKRTNHAAFLIPNGRVLVAGGSADFISGYATSEIYTPDPVASTDPTACASGFAADGYCCDRACTGTCEACNLPGKIGVCSPVTGAPGTGHGSCAPYLCAGADATGKGVCGKSCGTD